MFTFLEEREDGKENAKQFAHFLVCFTLEGELKDAVEEGGKGRGHGGRKTAFVHEHGELDPNESNGHIVENGKSGEQLANENRRLYTVLGVRREENSHCLRLLSKLLVVDRAKNCRNSDLIQSAPKNTVAVGSRNEQHVHVSSHEPNSSQTHMSAQRRGISPEYFSFVIRTK